MTREARAIAFAFVNGRKCRRKRTSTDGLSVVLLNNTIAYTASDGTVLVTLAGWPTVTTKDRVNAILDSCDAGWRIYQRKGVQYRSDTDEPIGEHEWIPVCGPLGMLAWRAARGLPLVSPTVVE